MRSQPGDEVRRVKLNVDAQIERGMLVCPETGQRLYPDAERRTLAAAAGARRYRLLDGRVPVLLLDEAAASTYASSSDTMVQAYAPEHLANERRLLPRLKGMLTRDYRTAASVAAFHAVFDPLPDGALCISVGGGPSRPHPRLVNLNIGPFPEVDVVADAHALPYADGCVDAIYCEAVLEHLPDPARAVREMFRVLRAGGQAYAITPFLQHYHGFPHHYQNFTITGHCHLFESQGFAVGESGTCVGPVYMMVGMVANFISELAPRWVRWPLLKAWGLTGVLIRPLDLLANRSEKAHRLASTTYLVARKP